MEQLYLMTSDEQQYKKNIFKVNIIGEFHFMYMTRTWLLYSLKKKRGNQLRPSTMWFIYAFWKHWES